MTTDTSDESFSIGELARTIGVTTRTLRYYEEVGLMEPHRRSERGTRVYSDSDVSKLKFILVLKEAGLSIKEIQELDSVFPRVRQTTNIPSYLIHMLDVHIKNLDDKMAGLAVLRKEIAAYRHRLLERFRLPVEIVSTTSNRGGTGTGTGAGQA